MFTSTLYLKRVKGCNYYTERASKIDFFRSFRYSPLPMKDASKPSTYVVTVDVSIAPRMINDLKSQGFELSKPAYTIFSARKKGVSCTLYESGKLTVQGKDSPAFIEFYLEPEVLGTFTYGTAANETLDLTPRIGIDESGKGDFFGPLCIAGVFADGEMITVLKKIGVKDSKTMTDAMILKLGKEIRKICPFHVIKINPLKYNELYLKFKNLNRLLAWGHSAAIEQLVMRTGCKKIIIDQFAAESVVESALEKKQLEVDLTQRHRGEEDVVVAAASILARQEFVNGLMTLGENFEMKLPKGASAAVKESGCKFLRRFGPQALGEVSKIHFKTYQEILHEVGH